MIDDAYLALLANAEDTTIECIQVAPMGSNKAGLLFTVSDPDYVDVYSLVFVLDDFQASTAERVLQVDEWLMSLTSPSTGELFALEATTRIWHWRGGTWSQQKISDESLRRVWSTHDCPPIVVGSSGTSYQYTGRAWEPLSPGLLSQLFDVDGDGDNGVFACGEKGMVQHLSDNIWQPIDIHHESRLRGIDVDSSGTIRLAGDNGVCLELRNGNEVIELDAPNCPFFSVCSYKGNHYWGNAYTIFQQTSTSLERVKDTGFAFDLREDGDFLYSTGAKSAHRYDGDAWKTVRLVYDDGFRLA